MKSEYYGPTPEEHSHFILGVEKMADIWEEVRDSVHTEHWKETETLYLSSDMDVDYPRYIASEEKGGFVLITCRDTQQDNKLVGDLMYYLSTSMHQKSVRTATEDAFYLLPEARSGGLAIKYLRYAETLLSSMGIGLIGMTDKSPCGGKSLKKLMDKFEYKQVGIYYSKEIGG